MTTPRLHNWRKLLEPSNDVDPEPNVLWVTSFYAASLALLATMAASLLSLYNIYTHLKTYTRPGLQRYVVRILIIVPLYAISSWICLAIPPIAPILKTIRDCYEAFVVYSFLSLILTYLGGEGACLNKMITEPPLRHPWPLSSLDPMDRDARFLRNCKKGVIQFVITKPAFALISLLMLAAGKYDTIIYQSILLIVYNSSYTCALYCLYLIYAATEKFLKPFRPVSKFLAVKLVVFMTYWQALTISVIPNMKAQPDLNKKWEDFVICMEMTFFAVLHLIAFSVRDFTTSFEKIPEATVLDNVKEVLSVNDIVMDAYHNFKPTYQDYVLQRGEDEVPEKYRARTFLVGNLDVPKRRSSNSSDSECSTCRIPALTPQHHVPAALPSPSPSSPQIFLSTFNDETPQSSTDRESRKDFRELSAPQVASFSHLKKDIKTEENRVGSESECISKERGKHEHNTSNVGEADSNWSTSTTSHSPRKKQSGSPVPLGSEMPTAVDSPDVENSEISQDLRRRISSARSAVDQTAIIEEECKSLRDDNEGSSDV